MNLAQITQSHALSFFHLSSPDFLLGWDSDPAKRNIFGLIEANPDLARAGIRLRQFGQTVIELLGAKKIHAAWAVPGGVRSPLSEEGRQWVRDRDGSTVSAEFISPKAARDFLEAIALQKQHGCTKVKIEIIVDSQEKQTAYQKMSDRCSGQKPSR